MTDKRILVAAGENLVEQAIRAGKIPESRRGHYLKLMQKRPNATAKLLDKLEAVLEPDNEFSSSTGRSQAAPVGAGASGPTDYPKDWLRPGEVADNAGGSITFEDDRTRAGAMALGPGL